MKLRTAPRALALVVLASPSVHAANFTWDGGATAGSEWSRANNWVGNAAPPSDGTADLFFDGSVRLTPEADADWSIRGLTFNSGAGVFVIGGNTLTIGPGGVTSNDNSGQTVQNDIVLASPQTFDTTAGFLTFEGGVNLNGNALTLTPAASSLTLRLAGQVSGSGGITKNGTGNVYLSGAVSNTFGGTLTVNDGNVFLEAPAAGVVMVPGALTIEAGSVIPANVSVLGVNEQIANSSAVTLNGGHFRVQGVSETIGMLMVNGGTAFAQGGGTLTVSGLAMDGGSISAGGSTGTLVLNGNATTDDNSSSATIGVTTLNLNNGTRTFTVSDGPASGDDLVITAQLTNGSLTKEGSGQMRLAGSMPNGATNTRVNAGMLKLQTTGGNAVSGSLFVGDGSGSAVVRLLAAAQVTDFGTVVVNAGATFDIGTFSETIGNLTLNGGTVDGSGSGTLTLNDNVASAGTVTSTISSHLNLGGVSRNFTVAETGAADDLRVSGQISAGALVKLGAGTLVLTGANTYTGGTSIQAGVLRVARLHENNAVTITSGKLQVIDSAPTLPAHPAGDNASVSRPSAFGIANNGAAIGSRVYFGQLDLGNNDLILDYSGASPIASIEDMVRAGYNGGDWLGGGGITSSTANANRNFALAVADNARLTIPFSAGRLFSGQVVDATTILVKFTHRIDLDLDGVITTNDATIFNSNYNEGQPAYWSIGDLDYDRVFTTNDATLFNSFYNEALASVPEPAAGAIVILAGALLTRRRGR